MRTQLRGRRSGPIFVLILLLTIALLASGYFLMARHFGVGSSAVDTPTVARSTAESALAVETPAPNTSPTEVATETAITTVAVGLLDADMATAVAATLTAFPTHTATPRPTATPSGPDLKATATAQAAATAATEATAIAASSATAQAQANLATQPATITSAGLRLRSGPGTLYQVLRELDSQETVTVLGRLSDASWLQILTINNVTGWVAAEYVDTALPVASYTVVAAPPAPPPCPVAVDGQLASAWNRAELGCATAAAALVWSAWQPFQYGHMLWRRDTDAASAFFSTGSWRELSERWNESLAVPSRGAPPPGLQAPVRGFGYVWGIHDDLFQNLGWATNEERGFCALIQPFEQGFLLHSSTVPSCWEGLHNYASEPGFGLTMMKVTNTGSWQGR